MALHTIFWMCWIFGFTFIQSFGFGIHDFGGLAVLLPDYTSVIYGLFLPYCLLACSGLLF